MSLRAREETFEACGEPRSPISQMKTPLASSGSVDSADMQTFQFDSHIHEIRPCKLLSHFHESHHAYLEVTSSEKLFAKVTIIAVSKYEDPSNPNHCQRNPTFKEHRKIRIRNF